MATGNMYRTFDEIWASDFLDTNKQADIQIQRLQYFTPLQGQNN